jgi:3-hydroxybutyryl-CoA dehydrogenase
MAANETVAVLGAGTMGHGIAQVSAKAGYRVRLYDLIPAALEKARGAIRANLDKGVEKNKLTPAEREATLANLSFVSDFAAAVKEADIVVEAAPEKLELKKEIFGKLGELCPGTALLGSNTSSLALSEIAAAAKHPERVIGMHFFNPPHLMSLLEVVTAKQTSPETLARTQAYAKAIGKTAIVVKDSPGFATSRLGIALGMEAIRMLEDQVASAEDIDRAMELGYNHPVGPLKLTDMVGLDVRMAIGEYLAEKLQAPQFKPPELLKKMVAEGKLGKKSGQGFYKW